MRFTLPLARAYVVTRAGLVALLAVLRVISMIDFYFPAERANKPGKSPPRTHVLREKSAGRAGRIRSAELPQPIGEMLPHADGVGHAVSAGVSAPMLQRSVTVP